MSKKSRMNLSLLLLVAFTATGCLDQKPKVLGGKKQLDFSAFDGGTQNLFKFNFALKGTTSGGSTTFYLQGASNTKAGLVGTCNFAGSGCECDFLDSNGASLDTASGSSEVVYDERGNYYRCTYNGSASAATVATMKIRNIAGTVTSDAITVETSGTGGTLTLAKLIGTELDINRVRHIFRYQCEFAFLQKAGTTTQSFDCTTPDPAVHSVVSCDPDGTESKNFCLLKAKFPFHLFSDTYSTNFHQKISDKIYNGGGTDRICGLQIKQIDCVGPTTDPYGTPDKSFGLFGEQTGIWDTSVQLGAGPDLIPTSFGFAARTSSTTNECPPGLEKRIFYKANGDSGIVTSDITPSHNFTSGLSATEVGLTTTTPTAFKITKLSGGTGGNCDPSLVDSTRLTECTLPNSFVDNVKSFSYTSTGQTEFCVIPESLLP